MLKLDEKGRISLPKFTYAEPGDKIALMKEKYVIDNETRLEIYPSEDAYTLSLNRQKNV